MLLTFASGQVVSGIQWPLIDDEQSVVRQLLSISKRWRISVLTHAAPSLPERFATDAKGYTYEELKAAEENKNRAAAARIAMEMALGNKPKRANKYRHVTMLRVEKLGGGKAKARPGERLGGGKAEARARGR